MYRIIHRSGLLFALLFLGFWATGQPGYSIKVKLKPFKNQYIYLGYYFGKSLPIMDSIKLNAQSEGVFQGKTKLMGGIYLIGFPDKKGFFEVLVDKEQHFSVSADSADILNSLVYTNSKDNQLFSAYQKFMNDKGRAVDAARKAIPGSPPADSIRLTQVLRGYNEEVQQYREDIEKKYPGSMLALLMRGLKEPQIPPAANHPGGKYDSAYAYQYYKSRFWESVSLSDERLLRTPFFEQKLEKYFNQIVLPVPDSIKYEADRIIGQAKKNKEMFKYVLSKLVEMYINPQYMGQDAVFVHLFEKYISNGEADWFNEKQKKYIFDRAYNLFANLIGQPAANLQLVDTLDKPAPLYGINAPYTVVCFWDPTCGHCKEVVPKVDSIFKAKWKAKGIKLYGVMVDGGKELWTSYIREQQLHDWTHAYETKAMRDAVYAANQPNFRQLYDVYTTPVLYLLDKDKRIIAKKLSWDQLDNVLEKRMNQ